MAALAPRRSFALGVFALLANSNLGGSASDYSAQESFQAAVAQPPEKTYIAHVRIVVRAMATPEQAAGPASKHLLARANGCSR